MSVTDCVVVTVLSLSILNTVMLVAPKFRGKKTIAGEVLPPPPPEENSLPLPPPPPKSSNKKQSKTDVDSFYTNKEYLKKGNSNESN
jgi:hypothetical protein